MNRLKKVLSKIHITTANGLVFCDRPDKNSYPDEIYHIHEKAKKIDASAVLFRRFYEEGEVTHSKPMVYIYYKNLETNSKEHKEIHKKIWSACEIDVYFIVSDTTINIFNARKPADIIDPIEKKLSLENLCLVHETLEKFEDQRFSALVFGKGVFWEQDDFFDNIKNPNFFRNKLSVINTPFQRLLEYLIEVRKQLHSSTNQLSIAPERIDKLLIICILIKFLEDKKDENGRHALEKIYKTEKVTDFAEAIEGGKFLSVLDELAREFNGNIFYLSQTEKKEIEEANLNLIADFLRANIDIRTKELFLWEQYSFNHLPVELISSIYENFLPREKGIVYTPPFLVNFLIDEVMPLNKAQKYFSKEQFKIFDPACGSGVFLVAAYKRLLQWWAINYFQEKSEFILPDKKVCQRILVNNIYGVDIHPTARLITVFSLTISLLDRLEPKELWNNLKLNNLQENIQKDNFFKWAVNNKGKKFDLVIGNPPFDSKKKAVTEKQLELFGINNSDFPNNNFALKFFEGAMFFGSIVCLILPSNALLY
ncbi:MAG: N-6 DNA methylase, partial [Candidatus Lokiarchaeota archaeon]|nr:N-6 DNA methylase [Candidatus Lokiarchaeota archaeon]